MRHLIRLIIGVVTLAIVSYVIACCGELIWAAFAQQVPHQWAWPGYALMIIHLSYFIGYEVIE